MEKNHWVMIQKRIFNFSDGSRKMVQTVLGFHHGVGFSVIVRTLDEAETIKSQLFKGGAK